MATWNWNVPGIHVHQPLTRPLNFSSKLQTLLSLLGDGKHAPPSVNEFFPEFTRLRKATPSGTPGNTERKVFSKLVWHTIWDLATKWDCAIGSTTMILHVDGTAHPAAPLTPEYLKANVYLPPSFIQENPDSHQSLASIAQLFLEYVGVPTVAAWTRRGHTLNWPLGQQGTVPAPPRRNLPVIPSAEAPVAPVSVTLPPPSSWQVLIYDIDEVVLDAAEADLRSAFERNDYLEGEVKLLRRQFGEYEEAIELYEKREAASLQRIRDLEAEVVHLQRELKQSETLARLYCANPTSGSLHSPLPLPSRSNRSGVHTGVSSPPRPPHTFPSALSRIPSLPRRSPLLVRAHHALHAVL
ncbi:hypothetical protein B0H19DRAFT_1064944 [Mycena capillaripes]|nr:hypothetical protein B0H19DRAFT_1064944 [Mycena capillaripes]